MYLSYAVWYELIPTSDALPVFWLYCNIDDNDILKQDQWLVFLIWTKSDVFFTISFLTHFQLVSYQFLKLSANSTSIISDSVVFYFKDCCFITAWEHVTFNQMFANYYLQLEFLMWLHAVFNIDSLSPCVLSFNCFYIFISLSSVLVFHLLNSWYPYHKEPCQPINP